MPAKCRLTHGGNPRPKGPHPRGYRPALRATHPASAVMTAMAHGEVLCCLCLATSIPVGTDVVVGTL